MATRKSSSPANLTVEILKQIRDEVRGVKAAQEQTNQRLDVVTERLDVVTDRLDTLTGRVDTLTERVDATNAQLAVHERAIVKLIHEVHGLNDRFDNFLHGAHHEDHADLRARVARLEAKVG
jgi:predicted nuclease with TOPRIM domain